jgi:aminoglycoside phosphotransferase (APT) family kinase protein
MAGEGNADRAARAVLDWDMGSPGDALFDVATLLSYWAEPGDPPAMHRLAQMPTASAGFLARGEALECYARCTGRDVSGFAFYRVLAMFKLGVVFLQISARGRMEGAAVDPRLANLDGLGLELLAFAHDVAQARAL